MSGLTLKEKLRARRERMKVTLNETQDDSDVSPRRDTWQPSRDRTTTEIIEETGMEEEDEEEKESEQMVNNLKKRRRKTQKQLSADLHDKDQDDISAQMQNAKQRTRQRIMAQGKAEEDEEEVEAIPIITEEDAGESAPVSSRTKTPRSARTPRGSFLSPDGGDTGVSPRRPSRNLSASIKQRLKDKIQKAKEEVLVEEGRGAGRRLAGLRGVQRTTRFDDPSLMDQEDLEAEERLRRSMATRTKWKDAADKSVAGPQMPSAEEAFNFFTINWPDPEPEPAEEPETVGVAEAAEATPAGEGEPEAGPSGEGTAEGEGEAEDKEDDKEAEKDKKKKKKKEKKTEEEEPLIDDLETQPAKAYNVYVVGRADYTPFHERMKAEDEILHYPSMAPAPVEEKIVEQQKPRYLEDEGFFVGKKPKVPRYNVHKMENRLLRQKEENMEWFGEDGTLIALPDPLKESPSRPPMIEEVDPALEMEYQKAVLSDFDSRLISGSLEGQGPYQLDVDVNTITFTHHHLFSREHVLAARLLQLYNQYLHRTKKKIVHFLTEKLRALRAAAIHVQENITLLKNEENENGTLDQKKRLQDYKYEIKQTRKQREVEMQADRTLLKNIIQTWKDIKGLRQFQQCTNTSVKLQIKKEPSDKAKDEAELAKEVEEELEEVRQEHEEEYHKLMSDYQQQLAKWKDMKLKKREATKRQKKRDKKANRRRRGAEEEEEEDQDLIDKDQELIYADDIPKPEKPMAFDPVVEKQKIIAKYEEISRKPGEPKLYPDLNYGATITQNQLCPRGEQQRRNEVSRCKVYVRVLFNNKEVSRTAAKPIGQDFLVRFAQIFNVQIVKWPENIKLEVYESSGLTSTLISSVFLGIPDPGVTVDNMQLDEVEFSSDLRVNHNHEGVGSGVPFSFDAENANLQVMMTTGTLITGVCWAVDEIGNVLVPPGNKHSGQYYNMMKGLDAVAAIGASGMADMDKLSKWIAQSRLDPNDPNNAELMCLLRPVGGGDVMASTLRMPEHFRLEQLQEEFNFVTDEEIKESRRFRLIQFREDEVPGFKNYKPIPAQDKEILDSVFDQYEKKKKEDEKLKQQEESSRRVASARFMREVREQIKRRYQLAAHQKTTEDMVYEEAVPNIGTIMPALMKLVERKRALKPQRRERKKITAQNLQQAEVKILINIKRAFDIPIRQESLQKKQQQGGPSGQTLGGSMRGGSMRIKNIAGETQVRPFVEVMFQRMSTSTSVADGPNPSWNESLRIPFKAPNNDFSPTSLQTVQDDLYINLFDEIVTDMIQEDRERGTSIHRRIEKRWLGNLKIPFSTIYFNSRIDGTFRVNKPDVLLGYTHDPSEAKLDNQQTGIEAVMGEAGKTYLTLFITIEPDLAAGEPVREKTENPFLASVFDTNENEKLTEVAETWQTELEKKFPKRNYQTMVVDINGKSVFVTRYFKALKPPEMLINGNASPQITAERVARFVSLIPFVSDTTVFPGFCDIWSTCDQFLHMLQGDEEEHAVMLTNYFLHLGKKAWLLLGSAIPEGPTAYVLTKEERDYWIWNASTGEHYSYRDYYCPVQSVGCLINQENIWANIQSNDAPSRISFDVTVSSGWKPFFHKGFQDPGLASVQPEKLIYKDPDRIYAQDTQKMIEQTLREKFMEWRPKNITRWNRNCMQSFRRLLEKLEQSRGHSTYEEHMSELSTIMASYKLCGFPINMAYTSMEPIIDEVYSTGVHNNETNNVEFALAVHVHPYPNLVLSVWIYVASLVRKA